ncbi:type IV secretion protein Rhs (plasmid) [Pseudomonas frederiksbergensis]|uniref:Type IV secretion protein Rhs n=1 Tax=Pseudomonas frederiksbergensis TaxID=104087 RepID=A0A1J0ETC2_9PSED|nr:RHS repeat-associated core domain-containing protein [Pseudomonas frederiksbergensis]APC19413.1 type IV secretion protein Rhs [Pseudomonas frederiksbergensis]
MFEAARFDDEIAHTNALVGFLVGAALGLALVAVASIFVVATCGFGAGLLVGLLAGLGGTGLVMAGEAIGRMCKAPAGGITSGSSNVRINGLKAAYVQDSVGICKKHSTPPMVAEGSAKVFINGLPAARKGDKLTCGSVIDSGSENVFIGAEKEQYLPIEDEVPEFLRNTVDILMIVAGLAGSLAQLAIKASEAGLKAAAPCALQFAAGFVAGELASRFVIGPAISRVAGGLFGNPVDAISGRKLLLEESETDFALPGLMPIVWARFYASDISHEGLLGRGWVLPWEQSLRLEGDQLYLRDNQGRDLNLPGLEPGERFFLASEQIFLVRSEGGHYLIQTLDNTFFYFGELSESGQPSPLRRIENALGHFLTFHYDAEERLSDVCATGGIRLHLCYDHHERRLSRVERVVDNRPVETLVHYHYDAEGQLQHVINRNGDRVRHFAYEHGLMVAHENALGLACHYRWSTRFDDHQPRVVEHWTSDGERYHFRYDLAQWQTDIRDVLDRVAQIHYNEGRRVVASRDFGGEQYRFELDASGNMTGLELPDGNKLAFAYDDYSRLVEEIDPLGRSTCYSYHLNTSLIASIQRPDGSIQSWVYDRSGTLLDSIDPLGQLTQYLNTNDGLPHSCTDPKGNTTHLWWNGLGQIEQYQDCSGHRAHYAYDERLHLVSIKDAMERTTRLTRKANGEVTRIEHPDGSHDSYSYNALGQLLSHTDADDRTTYVTRTSRGLLSKRQNPRGQHVHYEYDKCQRLIGLLNENKAAYRFSYDASDRLQEEVRVDGLRRRFSYSVSGALTHLNELVRQGFNEVSRQQHFEHDAAGRLVSRITDDARLDYLYDDVDRLIAVDRQPSAAGKALGIGSDHLAFSYDAAGQLLSEDSSTGNLGYSYDELGNLTHLALPDGRKVNHLYYGSGHLHQINLDGQLISDFERDALHRETLRTQGSLTSRYGYDTKGRKLWQAAIHLPHEQLSQLQEKTDSLLGHPQHPTTALHRRYHYSPGGEVQRVTDKQRGVTNFTYDASGQLRSRQPDHPQLQTEDFSYDPAGNLSGSGRWQFESLPDNRLVAFKDLRFSYDTWGNLSEKSSAAGGMQRFHYDSENRLIKAQTWQGLTLHSEAHYHYDALGRRIGKHVTQDGQTQETKFLWQGLRLLQEQQPQLHSLYLYEPGSYAPLARIDNDPELPEQEARHYYFHTDQIGTPQEMTNAEGQVVWRAYYKAWGGLEALSPNLVEQNLRFQGQYHDWESGLYYNTFRYYDPAVGRFTTQDPIGLLGGDNLYRYAPNALGWIDPWGWCNKGMGVNSSGHHVPAVRKSVGRPFAVSRSDKTRPTLFPRGANAEHDHWRMHDAERSVIGPRQGDFKGTDDELFAAYRNAYKDLNDIKVDVRSPNGTHVLGENVTPVKAVDLVENWLKETGLR